MNDTSTSTDTDLTSIEGKKRVDKIKKFYRHLFQWAGTSIFLVAIDLFMSHGITWSKFPVFFWGIALVMQFIEILRMQKMDSTWEDKMVRKHMGRKGLPDPDQTKDEDFSEELLRDPNAPEKEKADLSSYRKLKKPWHDEDLV